MQTTTAAPPLQLRIEVLSYPKQPLMRGEKGKLKVKLTDQQGKALTAATAYAIMTFTCKKLFDDANHENGLKYDGVYTNTFTVLKDASADSF